MGGPVDLSGYGVVAKALYEIDTQWEGRSIVPPFEDLLQPVRMKYLEKAAYVIGCQEIGREDAKNPTPAEARVG